MLRLLGKQLMHTENICMLLIFYLKPTNEGFISRHLCGCDYQNAERIIRVYFDCQSCESFTKQLDMFLSLGLLNKLWLERIVPSAFSVWQLTSPTELIQIASTIQMRMRLREQAERDLSTSFSDD